jgi:hypothetical protein
MAMEFAITGPMLSIDSDDSWQPSGSRSFLFRESLAILRRAQTGRGLEQHCVLR